MFNSSEFWKRMVRGKTNPKGFNYTPEKLRKEYIEDNHIECIGTDIYQDGVELEKKKFHYNYQAKYAPAKYQEVVDIRHKGKKKREKVHNIVYMYYKGDIPEGYVVDHINNDSLDNRPENLQALTRSENTKKNKAGHNALYYLYGPEKYEQRQKEIREEAQAKEERKALKRNKQYSKLLTEELKIYNHIFKLKKELKKRLSVNHTEEYLLSHPEWYRKTEQIKDQIRKQHIKISNNTKKAERITAKLYEERNKNNENRKVN